uniref:Uncharacterized protein n=1 Tax=Chromera velia CCMP2878 TaxID=1169474 RepID=A0A0G4FWF8_9ALVE|eukprot:Cvel_18976.t1-p1 / transcript=Cvel_18976.t1 / gene=Cvel_18976 / organism=Chromera_velia_CCMP2878 / gene_product=hypothetical protein / transcript_product=hypothetical protein / location=Cvel_scaffold1604:5470-7956(-) / protein_length=829 / sequence_SO=supercontig / SO=protein_coding / is_pseudo=false
MVQLLRLFRPYLRDVALSSCCNFASRWDEETKKLLSKLDVRLQSSLQSAHDVKVCLNESLMGLSVPVNASVLDPSSSSSQNYVTIAGCVLAPASDYKRQIIATARFKEACVIGSAGNGTQIPWALSDLDVALCFTIEALHPTLIGECPQRLFEKVFVNPVADDIAMAVQDRLRQRDGEFHHSVSLCLSPTVYPHNSRLGAVVRTLSGTEEISVDLLPAVVDVLDQVSNEGDGTGRGCSMFRRKGSQWLLTFSLNLERSHALLQQPQEVRGAIRLLKLWALAAEFFVGSLLLDRLEDPEDMCLHSLRDRTCVQWVDECCPPPKMNSTALSHLARAVSVHLTEQTGTPPSAFQIALSSLHFISRHAFPGPHDKDCRATPDRHASLVLWEGAGLHRTPRLVYFPSELKEEREVRRRQPSHRPSDCSAESKSETEPENPPLRQTLLSQHLQSCCSSGGLAACAESACEGEGRAERTAEGSPQKVRGGVSVEVGEEAEEVSVEAGDGTGGVSVEGGGNNEDESLQSDSEEIVSESEGWTPWDYVEGEFSFLGFPSLPLPPVLVEDSVCSADLFELVPLGSPFGHAFAWAAGLAFEGDSAASTGTWQDGVSAAVQGHSCDCVGGKWAVSAAVSFEEEMSLKGPLSGATESVLDWLLAPWHVAVQGVSQSTAADSERGGAVAVCTRESSNGPDSVLSLLSRASTVATETHLNQGNAELLPNRKEDAEPLPSQTYESQPLPTQKASRHALSSRLGEIQRVLHESGRIAGSGPRSRIGADGALSERQRWSEIDRRILTVQKALIESAAKDKECSRLEEMKERRQKIVEVFCTLVQDTK